jgi:hypothetical protein
MLATGRTSVSAGGLLTRAAIAAIALAIAVTPLTAQKNQPGLVDIARGAHRVVVATVTHVQPVFQVNEYGDQLIVSRTHLRVDEVLKGSRADGQTVVMEVEGGTLGDLTMTVSDLPVMSRGERAVVFLRQNTRGAMVPHERGDGILKLDSSDHVRESGLSLAAIRKAVASSQ